MKAKEFIKKGEKIIKLVWKRGGFLFLLYFLIRSPMIAAI